MSVAFIEGVVSPTELSSTIVAGKKQHFYIIFDETVLAVIQ